MFHLQFFQPKDSTSTSTYCTYYSYSEVLVHTTPNQGLLKSSS